MTRNGDVIPARRETRAAAFAAAVFDSDDGTTKNTGRIFARSGNDLERLEGERIGDATLSGSQVDRRTLARALSGGRAQRHLPRPARRRENPSGHCLGPLLRPIRQAGLGVRIICCQMVELAKEKAEKAEQEEESPICNHVPIIICAS